MLQKETKGTRGARSSKLCGSASHAHSPRGWKLSRQGPAAEIVQNWSKFGAEIIAKSAYQKLPKSKKEFDAKERMCLSSRPAR